MFENEGYITYPIVLSKKEIAIILGSAENNINLDSVKEVLERGKKFIERNFSVYFTLGVSEIKDNINCLPKCYKEAKEALKLKYAFGGNKIYSYKEVGSSTEHSKYIYLPIEIENIIINNITTGDVEGTKQVMEKLFYDYFTFLSYQPNLQRLFLMQLFTLYLKVIYMIGKKDDVTLSTTLLDYINEIEQDDVDKAKANLDAIKEKFIALARNINEVTNKSGSHLISRVIKFIDDNYCDPNLSLTYISDKFNISPQYLSTIFKEKVGMNLSDYIFQLRISKAKELLINTDKSVNEICQLIGYTHVSSFIKAFKKTEGISPAKYRSVYQKQ
ncbi:helix-turn-helix domain-containing protein [Caldicellulosiruptor hydrothermalis]|uniref:helix-turn-helix domain-containing protein n=1 Tax=Caldicellulosiruptor hydrothermalis TaxID=413888 RepID=UPI0002F8CB09|nr:AraC family transcriptional regulator [Caldicellulosiruptor hydrothermalis]